MKTINHNIYKELGKTLGTLMALISHLIQRIEAIEKILKDNENH
jgi:hypothetical protein